MDIFGLSFLFVLPLFLCELLATPDASCPETVHLELGVEGIIDCSYEDYQLIHWSKTGDNDAFIVFQNNVRSGPGFISGEYDLFLNGSLIIRNVSLQHERQYSFGGFTNKDEPLSSVVTVRVFVRPIPEYPVINGMVNRQNLLLKVRRLWNMECAMANVRPAISLEWVIVDGFPQNNLVINNDTTTIDHGDGTFSLHLRSHFKLEDTSVQSITILCVVNGPDVLSSNTYADVIFLPVSDDQSPDPVPIDLVPVIDGCYSKQLNCKQVTTSPTGKLTCTVMNVPTTDDVWIQWTPLGEYDNLEWDQTKPSYASGTVSRSLDYSIDEPPGTSLLEFQCRLLQRGFENVIGSADVTIEVQYGEVQEKHHRQTTASLVFLIIFILAFLVCLGIFIIRKLWIREMEKMRLSARGTENPESHRIVAMGMDRPPAAVEAPIVRHHIGTSANRAEAIGSDSKAEDETETCG